ncbi:hypothetical protein Nwat_0702 [Nitrosococcus watsonii C-113]|uniref:Uncharacterized protein n=1 Tax=Nitrosococcus watsoni (strain C-113) TaxID=105559 RepID=D8KBP7_NITWC|nr:hypothetical protein Nwat_0702 [Nitrosococcus watsonii C-113]
MIPTLTLLLLRLSLKYAGIIEITLEFPLFKVSTENGEVESLSAQSP